MWNRQPAGGAVGDGMSPGRMIRSRLSAVPVPDPLVEDRRERILLAGDLPSPTNPPAGCRFHTRCPFAKDVCRVDEPPLETAESGHLVACHFWREIQAAGGTRALPVMSATGAAVVESPFAEEPVAHVSEAVAHVSEAVAHVSEPEARVSEPAMPDSEPVAPASEAGPTDAR